MFKLAVVVWFGALWAFVAVMHARHIMTRAELSKFWKVNLAPLAVIGLLLDAAFNITFGTLFFRELPKEWLFSSRVQRHWRSDKNDRMAVFWAARLNEIDAGHIHEPRE